MKTPPKPAGKRRGRGPKRSRATGRSRGTPPERSADETRPSAGAPAASSAAKSGAVSVYDPLTSYIQKVRAYPELTREQEVRLATRYREHGDVDAARQLVLANLQLVVKISLMFRRAVANALDLIQEGNLGLMQAVEKFDPAMGVRLPTYAAWWIKAYILKYLLDNARMVRVGTTNARRKLIYNLQKEKNRLDALGFETGPKLLAEHFGVSEQDVLDVQATLQAGDLALDAPMRDGSDGEEGHSRITMLADDAESAEEQVARRQMQELIESKIAEFAATLNEKERAILEKRLVAETPATLQQIGDEFSITREAVRQAEERLLRKLKEHLRTELGEEFLLQIRR